MFLSGMKIIIGVFSCISSDRACLRFGVNAFSQK